MKPAPPVIRIGRVAADHATSPLPRVRRALRRRGRPLPARRPIAPARRDPRRNPSRPGSPSFSAALLPSQKQWRMSPMRDLPTISGSTSSRFIARAIDCANSLDAAVLPRADVEHFAGRTRVDQRLGKGARHVADIDKVAPLLAVLEDHRPLPVREPRRKDREHAGVRIGERLARAVDVEQAQAHAFHAVGLGHDQRLPLLHIFAERVDRREARLLPFGRRDGRQRAALRIERDPSFASRTCAAAVQHSATRLPSASRYRPSP